jgi:hypothetical protein
MGIKPLYEFDDHQRQNIVKRHLGSWWVDGIVTGPDEGTFGEIYSVSFPESHFPRRIEAKCPRFMRFGSFEKARAGIEQILHELVKAHQAFMVPVSPRSRCQPQAFHSATRPSSICPPAG